MATLYARAFAKLRHLSVLFLLGGIFSFAFACHYDSVGPSKEELNALRAELVLDMQNMAPQKKIAIAYTDTNGAHNIDFSDTGYKTSLAGSALVTIVLGKNISTVTALELWVDENGNGIKDATEKKTSTNCVSLPLVFSKENSRIVCHF